MDLPPSQSVPHRRQGIGKADEATYPFHEVARQGSLSFRRRGCLRLLARGRSGSALTARAVAHAVLPPLPEAQLVPRALLSLRTHRVLPAAPCNREFGPSPASLPATMASADFSMPLPPRCQGGSPVPQTDMETSQGKTCVLRAGRAGFTPSPSGRLSGLPVHGRVTQEKLALYPVSVRHVRTVVIGFLQIPPRGGHPCLDGRFPSTGSVGDLHPRNARHAWHTKKQGLGVNPRPCGLYPSEMP